MFLIFPSCDRQPRKKLVYTELIANSFIVQQNMPIITRKKKHNAELNAWNTPGLLFWNDTFWLWYQQRSHLTNSIVAFWSLIFTLGYITIPKFETFWKDHLDFYYSI